MMAEPLCALLFLVGIVGEDQLDASSKLANVLWCNWLGGESGTRLGSVGLNLFWLVSR
jgi:hypothetical protein